jgi:hypothetical protein
MGAGAREGESEKMRLALGLAIVSIALLGGCRESDEAVKAKLRADIMQRCTTNIAGQAAAQPGFDGEKYCTCVTDKAIGDHSVAELKKLFDDKAATAAQARQAATQCLAQQIPTDATERAGAEGNDQQAAAPVTPAGPVAEKAEAAGEADEESSEDDTEESQ